MKISFLILAHDNYLHLERLINALQDENVRFYVHIDKKSELPDNIGQKNVLILKNRVAVYWCGYSTIEATLNLLDAALKDGFGDYLILISGTDYPIRPMSFLREQLSEGREFINIKKGYQPSKPLKRFERFYFDGLNRKRKPLKSILFICIEKLSVLAGYKRRCPFQIFTGSQWFALTKNCAKNILETTKQIDVFRKFFKNTFCPDEAFFQSIIGDSHYFKNVKTISHTRILGASHRHQSWIQNM
jgi:hypothetical protein